LDLLKKYIYLAKQISTKSEKIKINSFSLKGIKEFVTNCTYVS